VIRRGAYPPINFGGRKMTEHLLTPSGEKRVQAILSDIEPGGGSGDDPYALPADVEFVYVVTGQLQVTVAGEQVTLDQGDAFTFPANIEHTFRATRRKAPPRCSGSSRPPCPTPPSTRSRPPGWHNRRNGMSLSDEHEPAKYGRPGK
jgi:quercetin dioxygenase-like cupin family protein